MPFHLVGGRPRRVRSVQHHQWPQDSYARSAFVSHNLTNTNEYEFRFVAELR